MRTTACLIGFLAVNGLIQGTAHAQPQPQNVNVVNTPNVNIVNTPTVKLSDIAVKTVKIFDQSDFPLRVVDVSAFRQIRLAAYCFTTGESMGVEVFVLIGEQLNEVVSLGAFKATCGTGASRTFEVPGEKLVINGGGFGRVVLYGRPN